MAIQYSDLKQRYQDLIGDSDGTIDAFGGRNINNAIKDILNRYKFSWDLTTASLTLTAGVSNLPTTYNPTFHLEDARIVASSTNDDNVFSEIDIADRDSYSTDDYVYWITWDATNHVYVFNSLTQTGTVVIYYYIIPATLTADADYCIIPDLEAVSYLAASKNWIGAERDAELKAVYEQAADRYIQALYLRDLQNGPLFTISSLVSYNLSGE